LLLDVSAVIHTLLLLLSDFYVKVLHLFERKMSSILNTICH